MDNGPGVTAVCLSDRLMLLLYTASFVTVPVAEIKWWWWWWQESAKIHAVVNQNVSKWKRHTAGHSKYADAADDSFM